MFISNTPTESQWASLDTSDHSSREWTVLLVNGIFLGVVVVVIFLRIWTKVFMTTKLSSDDYFMVAAALCFSIFCAINISATTLGFGRHIWDLPGITDSSTSDDISEAAAPALQLNFISLAISSPAIMLAKLSVLVILIRVFPQSMRALRVMLYVLAAVVLVCCTSQALMVIFQCTPVQSSWDVGAGSALCHIEPLETVALALGALNVVTDVIICITPIPYFLKLKISRPQKICLCGLFMSGLIACFVSIFRVTSLRGLNNNLDATYATVPYFNWSVCEGALIITTGSLPSLRPLLATVLPDFFHKSHYSRTFMSRTGKHSMASTTMTSMNQRKHRPESSWTERTQTSAGITITKEYQVEEYMKSPRIGGSFMRPTTPSWKFAPRAVVTCEKLGV